MQRRGWVVGVAVVGVVVGLAACDPLPGVDLVVTTTADGVDAAPGDGVCEVTPGEGDCSLRAAIGEANVRPAVLGRGRVVLAADATYVLTIAGSDEDAGATGDLDVVADLDLVGNGATIDAGGLDRVLDVRGDVDASFTGLTIKGGVATEGGGLRVARLEVSVPGGYQILTPHVQLSDSWVTGNVANGARSLQNPGLSPPFVTGEGGGGGVANDGTLDVTRTTISANRADAGMGCQNFPLWTCTFVSGGGLLNTGTANLVDVTIVENVAMMGAAIGADPSSPQFPAPTRMTTTVLFSTIADNERGGSLGYPLAYIYGDLGAAVNGRVVAGASVFAGAWENFSPSVPFWPGNDCQLPVQSSLGQNVSDDSSCFSGPTDLVSTPVELGPLADHGGPAPTQLPGGVLVDRIPAGAGCLVPVDARGVARPTGAACDVGAVERTPADG